MGFLTNKLFHRKSEAIEVMKRQQLESFNQTHEALLDLKKALRNMNITLDISKATGRKR